MPTDDRPSSVVAGGPVLLVVRSEPLPSLSEDRYHAWYSEHVAELLAIPGFNRARWFESVEGDMRYMATYEIASLDVLRSDSYPFGPGFGSIDEHVRYTRNVYREIDRDWFSA